jgi:hypothetical protein
LDGRFDLVDLVFNFAEPVIERILHLLNIEDTVFRDLAVLKDLSALVIELLAVKLRLQIV